MFNEDLLMDPLSSQCDYLQYRWRHKLWDNNDTAHLTDILKFVQTGYVYDDFDPNEWYPLGFKMAQSGQPMLWLACMEDLRLTPPDPYIIPYQSDNAQDICNNVITWAYWYPRDTFPVWDAKNKILATRNNPSGVWKMTDVHILLHAFATPQYVNAIETHLQIREALGLPKFKYYLADSPDLGHYFAWLNSLNVKVNPPQPAITKLPDLE